MTANCGECLADNSVVAEELLLKGTKYVMLSNKLGNLVPFSSYPCKLSITTQLIFRVRNWVVMLTNIVEECGANHYQGSYCRTAKEPMPCNPDDMK